MSLQQGLVMMVRSPLPWLSPRILVVLGAGLALLGAVSLAAPPTPAIDVSVNSQSIPNGTGVVAVGSSPVAVPKVQTFTVKNVGTAPLTLQ